jgi:uncharacterized Zn finger protein
MSWNNRSGFPEYITVAEQKKRIAKKKEKLQSKNKTLTLQPIVVPGRLLTKTFWGKAWCNNIESYADYAYRLDRGRSYVRYGAVADLKISSGLVNALVCGTRTYTVTVSIAKAPAKSWQSLIKSCAGKISSLVELLQGKFSDHIMKIMTEPTSGLFPKPAEISFTCSCPDHAQLCKHVAAVLYGIGVRLDNTPEHLFLLRSVDHSELLKGAFDQTPCITMPPQTAPVTQDLSELFGIEIIATPTAALEARTPARTAQQAPTQKMRKKKS